MPIDEPPPKTDAEYAQDVRRAVATLEHAMNAAGARGLTVVVTWPEGRTTDNSLMVKITKIISF